MLTLTQKAGESFHVREPSLVTVLRVLASGKVKLGIEPLRCRGLPNDLTPQAPSEYSDGQQTSPQRRQ